MLRPLSPKYLLSFLWLVKSVDFENTDKEKGELCIKPIGKQREIDLQMIKTNQDIAGEQFARNDHSLEKLALEI